MTSAEHLRHSMLCERFELEIEQLTESIMADPCQFIRWQNASQNADRMIQVAPERSAELLRNAAGMVLRMVAIQVAEQMRNAEETE